MSAPPSFSVVALAPSFADGLWRPEHFLLDAAAKHVPVVWMDPPHTRQSIREGRHASYGTYEPPPHVRVYQPPLWLPHLYRPAILRRPLLRQRFARAIAGLRAAQRSTLVLSLWRPVSPAELPLSRFALTTYHATDLYSEWGLSAQTEIKLLGVVGHTFASSSALLDYCSPQTAHCSNLPNGVDYRLFSATHPIPADLASIPTPRLIYTGVIKRQLRLDLIADLAERRPDLSFVLVGPISIGLGANSALSRMQQMPNVHLLGPKSVNELPGYLQHGDVGLLPYQLTNYTDHISPMKLYEYLATGIPCVGSPIRPLAEQKHLLDLATTTDEWLCAIQKHLDNPNRNAQEVARRQQAAREFDWDALAIQYLSVLAQRLEESSARS